MPRYINADALTAELNDMDGMIYRDLADILAAVPSADVAPVVHGEWLFIANGVEAPECSVCGWAVISEDFENRSGLPPYHKYCGHCGARMDGGT